MSTENDAYLDRQKEVLLALYRENCDQARQHETYRDKVCGLASATVGLLLGLFGFNAGAWASPSIIHLAIPAFIIIVGVWTRKLTAKHDERAALHRKRIGKIRNALETNTGLTLSDMNREARDAHEKDYHDKAMIEVHSYQLWKSYGTMLTVFGAIIAVIVAVRLCAPFPAR